MRTSSPRSTQITAFWAAAGGVVPFAALLPAKRREIAAARVVSLS